MATARTVSRTVSRTKSDFKKMVADETRVVNGKSYSLVWGGKPSPCNAAAS